MGQTGTSAATNQKTRRNFTERFQLGSSNQKIIYLSEIGLNFEGRESMKEGAVDAGHCAAQQRRSNGVTEKANAFYL